MSDSHEIFLSIVIVANKQRHNLEHILRAAGDAARHCSQEHEIVVVENGSEDGSVDLLESLCGEDGIPNLQIHVLMNRVENDIAAWAGVENALGDYVAVLDPMIDDIHELPSLIAASMEGVDVVFASNSNTLPGSIPYRIARRIFGACVKRFLGIDISREMPFFRVFSRKVINYMVRHNASGLAYRWLPASSGFRKTFITYSSAQVKPSHRRTIREIDRGMRMLVSSTFGPMRIVTLLSLFGGGINLLYSSYVIVIALVKDDVAPGWVTLSLQQSGMFFLISLVFLVLAEYIINMAHLTANVPSYYITEEFTSAIITRRERLNVEVSASTTLPTDIQRRGHG